MKKTFLIFTILFASLALVSCDGKEPTDTEKYTVIFDVNAGEDLIQNEPEITRVNAGETVNEPELIPIRDGYDFIGWYDNENGDGVPFDFQDTPISKNNFILFAIWSETIEYHQIVFVIGENTENLTSEVPDNMPVDEPNIPEKTGYRFDGWYVDDTFSTAYNFDSIVNSDFTLYAKWIELVTLSYDFNYEGAQNNQQVTYDLGVIPNTSELPIREGFVFGGWYLESELVNSYEYAPLNNDLTLYAKWIDEIADSFDVAFIYDYDNGPEDVIQSVIEGAVVTAIDTNREGYRFDGWYLDNTTFENKFLLSTPVAQDLILYGKWIKTSEITIDYNYEGAINPEPLIVDSGDEIIVSNPSRIGYVFSGWSDSALGNIGFNLVDGVTESTVIYAQWEKTNIFETEYLDFSDFFGWGFSGNATGTDAIIEDVTGVGQASNDHYVSYLYGDGITLTYEIYSDRDVSNVTMILRLSGEVKDFYIKGSKTPSSVEEEPIYTIKVNDSMIDYNPISFFGVPSQSENTILPFQDYVISINIDLVQGLNTIELITDNQLAMGGTMGATAPMVDNMQLITYAILTWNPILDNY
jgi:uncharacterized repeat protein (TIGR02543 family)